MAWTQHTRLWPVTLNDGTRAFGPLMRRRGSDGRWEYRRMTEAEQSDYVSADAW